MLTFKYDDLEVQERGGSRFYITPEGNAYPSVTTFLDKVTDTSFLEDWEDRVGSKEVNRIQSGSTQRGNIVHDLCEKYVLGQSYDESQFFYAYVDIFKSMQKYLDNIEPWYTEKALYSDVFRLAGRTDCLGTYNSIPSVIDYKTAGKPKRLEWIESYFLQTCCYSYMVEWLTGVQLKQLVIIIGVHDSEPQIFIEDRSVFRLDLKNLLRGFLRG